MDTVIKLMGSLGVRSSKMLYIHALKMVILLNGQLLNQKIDSRLLIINNYQLVPFKFILKIV